jgi:hypothetical protein
MGTVLADRYLYSPDHQRTPLLALPSALRGFHGGEAGGGR